MSSPSFRFRQFEVFHDRCGMKVGTDGVLLGAWVQPGQARRILDVGTGSGLVALILAQHSSAEIVAVEYDEAASAQAAENFNNSPWAERMTVKHLDFRQFQDEPFDLIVSNPPYFQAALKAPKANRSHARHDVTLSYVELVQNAYRLLSVEGRLAVVLPKESEQSFERLCQEVGLFLTRCCDVSTVQGKAPKRVLLEFSRKAANVERAGLVLSTPGQSRSEAYRALTSDLYL